MSTKNLINSPQPENILNALSQATQPLTINELAEKTNVVTRSLLNPIIQKLVKDGKVSKVGENPPKFVLSQGSEFALTGQQTPASKTKPKPASNVHHITPKNPRPEKAATQPRAAAPVAPAAPASTAKSSLNIRDSLLQLMGASPRQLSDLEGIFTDAPQLKAAIKSLNEEHLVIQEKIMGSDSLWLSPRGEELFTKLVGEGKLSLKPVVDLAPATEQPSKAQEMAPVEEISTEKRSPGRPKGSTNKPKETAKAATAKPASKAAASTTEKAKSAAPKGATASPKPAAATAPAPAPEKPAAPAVAATKAAAPAPSVAEPELPGNLGEQLMGLLEMAAKGAVAAQLKVSTEREAKNAKIAEDMAAISTLMLDLGARLQSLSESMQES